jgi:VIT1/CCC1 family predicted Fe2+/Mn2+ transporter
MVKKLLRMNADPHQVQKNDFWKSRMKEWTALDPPERISEVLFGLIMVLTFTGSISVSTTGKQEIRELLWAALGCNLAWGLVDAIMYLMDELIVRAHGFTQIKRMKRSGNSFESREIIRENISPFISELMEDEDIDKLGERIRHLPEPSMTRALIFKDYLIGVQIFILVFLSTFPVALPFFFINDVAMATRISNGVAVLLLFTGGFFLARYAGLRPVITALAYAAIGMFLVALTIALGG